ncbi:molybdopterin molybdotransferase MoeA, partial [Methylobacterium radiotolerans]|uniref:molybdopterin molybdotransferase MoeA n=1 Tax=Methylobacterium radiotolerans TaxID=31998 RepID=UPI000B7921DB
MSGLIPVAEALARVLASVAAPVEAETVPLARAGGRTLAADVVASRTQPPFPASAMDGYAVRSADAAAVGATLRLIGTSAAGHGFPGRIGAGEAVRIFTGAPVPEGADAILIQEDAAAEAGAVRVLEPVEPARFIRRAGLDFTAGQTLIPAGTSLDARRLALAAAAGHPRLPVRRRPRVAILATGDELVEPGATPGWDQIVASNSLALGALAAEAGADIVDLGIAGDDHDALADAFRRARAARADLLVTLGGASVGDHDLVQAALAKEGLELGFWRVALRPGKPLMHGRLGDMLVIGLPGRWGGSACGWRWAGGSGRSRGGARSGRGSGRSRPARGPGRPCRGRPGRGPPLGGSPPRGPRPPGPPCAHCARPAASPNRRATRPDHADAPPRAPA